MSSDRKTVSIHARDRIVPRYTHSGETRITTPIPPASPASAQRIVFARKSPKEKRRLTLTPTPPISPREGPVITHSIEIKTAPMVHRIVPMSTYSFGANMMGDFDGDDDFPGDKLQTRINELKQRRTRKH